MHPQACVEGRLDSVDVGIREGSAVTVAAVSEGYPGSYPKGRPMTVSPAQGMWGPDSPWRSVRFR